MRGKTACRNFDAGYHNLFDLIVCVQMDVMRCDAMYMNINICEMMITRIVLSKGSKMIKTYQLNIKLELLL